MNLPYLMIAALACWRLSHLVQVEPGPWRLATSLRGALLRAGAGDTLACFLCLSLWVAMPLAYAGSGDWQGRLLLWPAISAGAILAERLIFPGAFDPAPIFHEDLEETSHVLR